MTHYKVIKPEKLKICPNGFHSNGHPDCYCGTKGWVDDEWVKNNSEQHYSIGFKK